ncbi:MAG: cbb3-type cytochrome c oxidase subunit 3 [Phycisphaerae bacterium]|nr:cbb3-type cytochrome c oxidase subunit 3 [Phycisphaerae bacterium]
MSELISSFKLTTFPIVALVIFTVAFAALCWKVFRPGQRDQMNRHASIPLGDD